MDIKAWMSAVATVLSLYSIMPMTQITVVFNVNEFFNTSNCMANKYEGYNLCNRVTTWMYGIMQKAASLAKEDDWD